MESKKLTTGCGLHIKIQSKVIANGKYGNQFLAYNYKATNEHINKHHVAFLLNVFQIPNDSAGVQQ